MVLFPTYIAIVYSGHEYYGWMIAVACLYTVSGVFMHRANIRRLLNGTENKIGHHVNVAPAETAEETSAEQKTED